MITDCLGVRASEREREMKRESKGSLSVREQCYKLPHHLIKREAATKQGLFQMFPPCLNRTDNSSCVSLNHSLISLTMQNISIKFTTPPVWASDPSADEPQIFRETFEYAAAQADKVIFGSN